MNASFLARVEATRRHGHNTHSPDGVAAVEGLSEHGLAFRCMLLRRLNPLTTRSYLRLLDDIGHLVAYRLAHPCRCGIVSLEGSTAECVDCRLIRREASYAVKKLRRADARKGPPK